MVIHSVTPPHMLVEQPQYPELQIRQVAGGYMEGYQTLQGFQMSRLCSTDPAMYLRSDYAPGSVMPNGQLKMQK